MPTTGMSSGLAGFNQMYSPENAFRRAQEMQRREQEDRNQLTRQQSYNNQGQENSLLAQRYALDQSNMMQSDMSNGRQVTDTSMTIPYDGSGSGSGSGSRASGAGGNNTTSGTRPQLPPNIQGHYMPLIDMNFTPNETALKRETMSAPTYGMADAHAYQDAEFGNLKAKAGSMGRSALQSFKGEMSGRGIGSSGTASRGIADRIAAATNPLADLNVAHLKDDYQNSQMERQLAETRSANEYSGNITQRGQDASMQQALNALKAQIAMQKYNGDISQRSTDLEALLRTAAY